MPELQSESHSVILLGSFNPMIFHPKWLSDNELIPRQETEEAQSLLLTLELTTFVVSNIHFQVEQQKFGISSNDPSKFPVLRDLALGCFQLLEHTPLTAVGLNFDLGYRLDSEENWHSVGHRLAPKAPWEGIIDDAGMRVILMEGKRRDCTADLIMIRVQPTALSPNSILVATNQHYQLDKHFPNTTARNRELVRLLNEDWLPFRTYAYESSEKLIST